MRLPVKMTFSCIWVSIPVDWVVLRWYACGADGRSGGRSVGVRSRDYQIFENKFNHCFFFSLLPFFSFPLFFAFYFLFFRECEGRSQPIALYGPGLWIFGLTTLPLVINYKLLGWAKKAQEVKVLVTSVRTGHACNFQDMWKWKSARSTTSRKAGYVPVCQACTVQMK